MMREGVRQVNLRCRPAPRPCDDDPPLCPNCGEPQFLFWDEDTDPELICPECTAFLLVDPG